MNLKIDENIGVFEINGEMHFHIESVVVQTSADDTVVSDALEVFAGVPPGFDKPKLMSRKCSGHGTFHRLRGEPGVVFRLVSENGNKYLLEIGHHKGSLSFRVDLVTGFGDYDEPLSPL